MSMSGNGAVQQSLREEVEKLQGRVRELEEENKGWAQKVDHMQRELD